MIISSLLDTDLYKFTMMQLVFHRFASASTTYEFKCRTAGVDLLPIARKLRAAVRAMSSLRLSDKELDYMRGLGCFQEDFLSFLRNFKLDASHVKIKKGKDGLLAITIKGPWLDTILWEVPLLATINELHFQEQIKTGALPSVHSLWAEGRRRLDDKINILRSSGLPIKFAEFGTRRRFSKHWHWMLTDQLMESAADYYAGTSNMALAMRHGVPCIGTMAHEYLQACQALAPSLEDSQRFAFQTWLDEYQGKLAVALSDVFGFDAFLADFTPDLAAQYSGTRHDSGDPFEWGEKQIADWKEKGFDPRTKTAVFSDGLDFPKAVELFRRFHEQIKVMPAIGTNTTNDLGPAAINNVIKMVELNGLPVAKISDAPGKTMCKDLAYLTRLSATIDEKVKRWKASKIPAAVFPQSNTSSPGLQS